jgi:hypothetical protein
MYNNYHCITKMAPISLAFEFQIKIHQTVTLVADMLSYCRSEGTFCRTFFLFQSDAACASVEEEAMKIASDMNAELWSVSSKSGWWQFVRFHCLKLGHST